MRKRLLIPICLGFLFLSWPISSQEPTYNKPVISAVDVSDGLDEIYKINPLVYTIVIGLIVAVGALSTTVVTIWKKYGELSEQNAELHKDKLKIALSTTETIKEALFLVQNIYEQVSKLNSSEIDRRLVDLDIKNHLINISNDIEELKSNLKSKLNENM